MNENGRRYEINRTFYSPFSCYRYIGASVILCRQKHTNGTSRSLPFSLFFRRPDDCYGRARLNTGERSIKRNIVACRRSFVFAGRYAARQTTSRRKCCTSRRTATRRMFGRWAAYCTPYWWANRPSTRPRSRKRTRGSATIIIARWTTVSRAGAART